MNSINKEEESAHLRKHYEALKKENPKLRARDLASRLGVSEGELVASFVGENSVRLVDDIEGILKSLLSLGRVMALTRNESCVHERKGVYDNSEFLKHCPMVIGMFVNPDIDLRLFLSYWKYHFAVTNQTAKGERKSLQFFDQEGTAIHKIYLTEDSDEKAYENLVSQFKSDSQETFIEVSPVEKKKEKPDSEIDWKGFRKAWEGLKDTHDFDMILRKFSLRREQALKNIGEDYAFQVSFNEDSSVVSETLHLAKEKKCEIMVFVGNRGCLQIHTGPVENLVRYENWYNVMDSSFSLHLNENQVARSWIVKKPTKDGMVTSLELYDEKGELIVTFFGKRKPGIPELETWREILSQISQCRN